MQPEHPTGLEIRFERELAAAVPGWESELAALDPLVEPRPPRPVQRRVLPRHLPHRRRVTGRRGPDELAADLPVA